MKVRTANRVVDGIRLGSEWHGGEYIEVSYNGQPSDVINVWDYEMGRALIEDDSEFRAEVDNYIAEEDIVTNYENYRY